MNKRDRLLMSSPSTNVIKNPIGEYHMYEMRYK